MKKITEEEIKNIIEEIKIKYNTTEAEEEEIKEYIYMKIKEKD